MSEFGEALKGTRQLLRITQTDLAEQSGISQGMIALIEGGKKGAGLETAGRLAAALIEQAIRRRAKGLTVEELATMGEEPDGRFRYEVVVKRGGLILPPLTMVGRRPLAKKGLYKPKPDQLEMMADFIETAVEEILRGEGGEVLGQLVVRETRRAVEEGQV